MSHIRIAFFVLLSAVLMLQISCTSSGLEKEIIGKWVEIDGSEKMEFFKDGTIMVTESSLNMSGKYSFLEKNRIKVELGGLGMLAGPQIAAIEISNEQLTITEPNGKKSVYRRE